eukprot:TRINITY_DN3164_c0_g1_i4.p1 TRINITY_DN3164_c0_g1~~TRINITY_DN3164_c0_g1_i4.p1  ORF type:complete len:194 (+),score=37.78 TRINITY_DN3164_c0_g1_i4:298-879(+)
MLKESETWGDYEIEYVGSKYDAIGSHEGHSGLATYQFVEKLEGDWLQDFIPDIVLINVGTQDLIDLNQKKIDFDALTANLTESLGEIIQTLIDANPGISIVISEIPPIRGVTETSELNERIQQYLQVEFEGIESLSPDTRISYMPLNIPTDWNTKYLQKDGIHPNHNGEKWIASQYYEHLVKIFFPDFEIARR